MRSFCQKIIVVVVLDGSSSSSDSASIGTAVVEEQRLSHRCGSAALFEDLEFGAFLLSESKRLTGMRHLQITSACMKSIQPPTAWNSKEGRDQEMSPAKLI